MPEVNDTSKAALRVGTSLVCFLFRGVKNVTAKMLQAAIREHLKKRHALAHGEQPISKLIKHGSKLESLEITDQNIKAFERIAKKYGLDFSLEKDRFSPEPIYFVFFKSHDVEIMQHAFREYAHMKLPRDPIQTVVQDHHQEQDISKDKDKELRPSTEKADKPTLSTAKDHKMDLRAELEQCKAESAEQMKELAKGHAHDIAPKISMEPDR